MKISILTNPVAGFQSGRHISPKSANATATSRPAGTNTPPEQVKVSCVAPLTISSNGFKSDSPNKHVVSGPIPTMRFARVYFGDFIQ